MKLLDSFKNTNFFPIFLLLLAMISIQSGASLAKQLFPIAGALGTSALRLSFAALIMSVFWRPWKEKISKKELKLFICYGLSLGLMNLFFYLSIARIPLGIAVAIEFTGPLVLTIFSSKKLLDLVWILFAGLGIVFILPVREFSSSIDLLGIFFAFVAAFFWALYILFGAKASQSSNAGIVASVGMIVAAIIVVPIGIIAEGSRLLNPGLLLMGVGVALFSSAIPYSLEMFAMKRIPTKKFGILLSLEPAFGALSGLIFLKEYLSVSQWIAILFIITASVGVSMTSTKKMSAIEL